jgi:hypothetical protein
MLSLHFLRSLFENILINRVTASSIESQLNSYTGDYRAPMATALYALQSVFTDAKEAAWLQVPIARQLHLFQNLGVAFYYFEIVLFLETFWVALRTPLAGVSGSRSYPVLGKTPFYRKCINASQLSTTKRVDMGKKYRFYLN